MKKRFKCQFKVIFTVSFFLISMVSVGLYQYHTELDELDAACTRKLQSVAYVARYVVGDGFHDRVAIDKNISNAEDMENILALSNLAEDLEVKYIYTMIVDQNDTLRFTSSSATKNELSTGKKVTHFFDIYAPYPKMLAALKNDHIVYDLDNDTDAWGSYRSIFIPCTTKNGVRYIIGVDIDNLSMKEHLQKTVLIEIGKFIFLFLTLLPLLIVYRNYFYKVNHRLRLMVDKATQKLTYMNGHLESLVEEKSAQVLKQALVDPLTELPNRIQLQQDLNMKGLKAIALINLDNFKEINNFFGIPSGDKILREVAQLIQGFGFKAYRLNGDEFVLLKKISEREDIDENDFNIILENIQQKEFGVGLEKINVNVTTGIAIGEYDLLREADIAMHLAKRRQQRVMVYKQEYEKEQESKRYLETSQEIRKALGSSRIVCYYQPIVNPNNGKKEKYESLARMILEDGTIVPPREFLEVAHKTRLYSEITKEIVYQACTDFKDRSEEFSINLSAKDILSSDIVDFIQKTILETGTANRVVFEILESEGIENYSQVSHFITIMKKHGAKIAIDDFGSGYSSFENILKLNIDYLKIDGSLIKNIDHDERQSVIVHTIIEFAHKIGIKTIAEFVATEEIAKKVQELGIDYSQGYYYGQAEPLSMYI
ncbi:GGDEF and EAL domain-containing protein [Sulfuricurvum sp. PD_MW2]|uniref:putative bifunctional diguanylate cyclase/phosphodiesterase n=1 Tax=Sulfuricurvum sp. PD_MW2 TaxID=2027917 RepID=UPI0025F7F5FE|nr:GGDEF and EAL domain-containing protein [Sulfuricurvum sp. PD_MW2]